MIFVTISFHLYYLPDNIFVNQLTFYKYVLKYMSFKKKLHSTATKANRPYLPYTESNYNSKNTKEKILQHKNKMASGLRWWVESKCNNIPCSKPSQVAVKGCFFQAQTHQGVGGAAEGKA